MYCTSKISDDLYYIGESDRRLALFENIYPIPKGVSYNSYLLMGSKTVLLDTVDSAVRGGFIENIQHTLGDKPLDYIVVNHVEPDHAATLCDVLLRWPMAKVVTNVKAKKMLENFYGCSAEYEIVKEGDVLDAGNHKLTFVMAPMVHWPEAMVTFDTTNGVLFSADAFGSFGAISGNIFADQVNFEKDWLDETRRYYTNIVGKYGVQVQNVLKKAADLPIKMICPLHGLIWRKNINVILDKYLKWAAYESEQQAVMIAYSSIYGGTQNAVDILARQLAESGVKNIAMYDVASVHPSIVVSECFRCSHLVFAAPTYNAGIFTPMENVLTDIKAHNIQNKTVAIIENGSWAPLSGGLMQQHLEGLKNIKMLGEKVSLLSAVKNDNLIQLEALAAEIVKDIKGDSENQEPKMEKIQNNVMFNLSYGLFVLTSCDGKKSNGCIINTVMQVTDSPKTVVIAVNNSNYTHDIILKSKKFNLSVLSEDAQFEVFKHFGFQSGRTVDKFSGYGNATQSDNGCHYLTNYANSYMSCEVIATIDMGTHTLFTAKVTEAKSLNTIKSATYAYYFANIKPKPQAASGEKGKEYICKICGHIHKGELPADIICPLCKHGAADFELIK